MSQYCITNVYPNSAHNEASHWRTVYFSIEIALGTEDPISDWKKKLFETHPYISPSKLLLKLNRK